jgi:hypothetical protein
MKSEGSLPVEAAAGVDRTGGGGMHSLASHQAVQAQAARVNMPVRAHLRPAVQLLLHQAARGSAPASLAHQQRRPVHKEVESLALFSCHQSTNRKHCKKTHRA